MPIIFGSAFDFLGRECQHAQPEAGRWQAASPTDADSTFIWFEEARMNRREFVSALGVLPFAAEAALTAQAVPAAEAARLRAAAASPFPVIDTHIHIFDKTRVGGMPYPRDMPGGGEPQQGYVALPGRYRLVASPFGVVGAIIVEASPRLEDNFWLLDVAKDNPIIVGLVGRIGVARADARAGVGVRWRSCSGDSAEAVPVGAA